MTATLANIIPAWVDGNIWLIIGIKFVIAAAVFLAGVSFIAMFSIWWERKVAGHAQSRLGPMHTGGWHGWSQSLADGLKLIQKEDLMPASADAFMFKFAPYLAFGSVFAAFLALPFAPQLCFEGGLDNGLLYILAVLAVEVMAVILAGWGSNSKWAIYGAMREACQMVSYEVPLGLSLICGILVAGTLNLVELGYLQGGGIQDWYAFHNPFLLVAFIIYFIASLASSKRAPFDLPESESELVSGFHTEYSGLRFSFFFFAEYAGLFVVGALSTFLFLGGWNSPLGPIDPVYSFIGYDPIAAGQVYVSGQLGQAHGWAETAQVLGLDAIGLIILNVYAFTLVILKVFSFIFLQIWLRWTLPRIRIDQVLYTCVKVLLPLSLVALVGTACWLAVVPQPIGPTIAGQVVPRLGHLTGETPMLQLITQVTLMLLSVGFLLSVAVYVFSVFVSMATNRNQPPKTFFSDVMPVGNQIAFTKGDTLDPEAA